MVIKADEKKFRLLLEDYKYVVVDFYAEWCGPCQLMKPIFEKLSNEKTDYIFASVNLDENPSLADQYRITSIPCLIMFKNGDVEKRKMGYSSEHDINEWLRF